MTNTQQKALEKMVKYYFEGGNAQEKDAAQIRKDLEIIASFIQENI